MILDIMPTQGEISTRHSPRRWFDSESPLDEWLFMYFHTPFCLGILDDEGNLISEGTGGVGDCLLHPPGRRITHGPAESISNGFINDWIYFVGSDAEKIVNELSLPVDTAFHVFAPSFIDTWIRSALAKERDRSNKIERLSASLDVARLLVDTARNICHPDEKTNDPVFINISRLRTEMFAKCGEEWNNERLSALSGYSMSHFLRLYRKYFDNSPMAELSQVRIEIANNMLLNSDHPIGYIANVCGFSSMQYFSRIYRETVGCSPSQTRSRIEKAD